MSAQIQQVTQNIIGQISQKLIGKDDEVLLALTCLIAGGHVLLEDVPGLGKTTLAKALAASIGCEFKRIQCTPDMMPSDITGVSIYNQKSESFQFVKGPVFTNILLADEINRTNPRTQSALLEAMAEGTVTVDRETFELAKPFFVIATQNPIDFSGTYSLPEAQMDRFMMQLSLGYPNKQSEIAMMQSQRQTATANAPLEPVITAEHVMQLRQHAQNIHMNDSMYHYIADIVRATREHDAIQLGASPRACLALMKCAQTYALLTGETHVTPALVQKIAEPVLAHRLIFKNRQMSPAQKMAFFDDLLYKRVTVPDNPNKTSQPEMI